jgi:putative DNA primase/helicase
MNGTLELDTGKLRPHSREDYLTKLVHVDYTPDAQCPRWLTFLKEILGEHLVDYIQRALGYSLTGSTTEKAVFILCGKPDAGKSTLLATFRELIHEFAVVIQAATLMSRAQESNNALADLADLRGARFVHTSECERDQRLSQSRLKAITQGSGSLIKATRKFENPITFPETHKLWLDTNDLPRIKEVDDQATFNRLHTIPFPKSIPKEKIDKTLGEKLKAESEGILAWAVQGAQEYCKHGLGKPAKIADATENWRAQNDNIARFLEERCECGDAFSVAGSVLYGAYHYWCEQSGERFISSSQEFSQRLTDRGYTKSHGKKGTQYHGLRVKDADEA